MNGSGKREVRVRIDRLVITGMVPGLVDARGLEAAVAEELGRLIASDVSRTTATVTPSRALARQIAREVYRKVARAC